MDYQSEPTMERSTPEVTHAIFPILELKYDNREFFDSFFETYQSVLQHHVYGSGHFFEIVTDGRMLFFWKTERVLEHSQFNLDDKATPTSEEDNENGYTIFRLFKLDLHLTYENSLKKGCE